MTTSVKIPLASLRDNTIQQVLISAILEQYPYLNQKEVASKACASTRQVRRVQSNQLELDISEGYVVLPLEMLQRMKPLAALLAIEFVELQQTFGQAVISNKKLANKFGVSVSSVKDAKLELEQKKLLIRRTRFSNGYQVANSYSVHIDAFERAYWDTIMSIYSFPVFGLRRSPTGNSKVDSWLTSFAETHYRIMTLKDKPKRRAA